MIRFGIVLTVICVIALIYMSLAHAAQYIAAASARHG
jgi:hypothetical protein